MKKVWRRVMDEWKDSRGHLKKEETLPKEQFPKLLKKLVDGIENTVHDNIISGFRACGVEPLDRSQVLKNIPSAHVEPAVAGAAIDRSLLERLEKKRGPDADQRRKRSRLNVLPGKSVADHMIPDSSDAEPKSLKVEAERPQEDEDGDNDEGLHDISGDGEEHVDEASPEVVNSSSGVRHSNEETPSPVPAVSSSVIHANDFVQFCCNDAMFCGEVVAVRDDGVRVRAMTQCRGGKYRWPRRDDITVYPFHDIVQKIGDPIPVGNRGYERGRRPS